jgi:hypothetical protein
MRTISASVDIAASPEEVWAVLAELGSYGQWNPFIQSAAGRLAVGEKLTLRLVPSQGRAMTFRPQVLVVKPGIITQTETDFNNLNQALKQRVEARQ